MIRTYSNLIRLPSFLERYRYLKLDGAVGKETFGFDRYLNQAFYRSYEWRHLRDEIIVRDCGCDLAMDGYEIYGRIYIHHMNPATQQQIALKDPALLDPEFLVCVTYDTHNAIHYGSEDLLKVLPKERTPNDTCPWRK